MKTFTWSGVCSTVIALLCALLLGRVLLFILIPTGSMEPTLEVGSVVFGIRLFDRDELLQGDIVGFKFGDSAYIKRIVGTPGDVVSFRDGAVYVNGVVQEEEYLPTGTVTQPGKEATYTVPEGSYFVMGDNRGNSYDSRYWTEPFVASEDILSKAVFYFGPLFDGRIVGAMYSRGWFTWLSDPSRIQRLDFFKKGCSETGGNHYVCV